MADQAFTILDLNAMVSGDISTPSDVWTAIDDDQGVVPVSKKMNITELAAAVSSALTAGVSSINQITVTSHGFTSADVGKPLTWDSAGVVAVWDDTADPEAKFPIHIIKTVVDANTLVLAACGEIIEVADTLLPTGVPNDTTNSVPNSRALYWDSSAGKYQFTLPIDSTISIEAVFYLQAGPTASHSLITCLLPSRPYTTLEVV